jgi:hypothetical protein
MDERQGYSYARGQQIQSLLRQWKLPDPRLGKPLATLDKILEEIKHLSARQGAVAGVTPSRIRNIREDLRVVHLIPIARAGKRIFRHEPTVLKALKVPHKGASNDELVEAATAMVKAVQRFGKLFVEEGFSKGFLVPVRDLTRELKRWSRASETTAKVRGEVTAALRQQFTELRTLFPVIEGFVAVAIRNDKPRAVQWRNRSRTPRRMGRPKKKTLMRVARERAATEEA